MKKFYNFLICLIALVVGVFGGGIYVTYITLPETDELIETSNQFYSFNENGAVNTAEFSNAENVFSVHFLELGNKYTGDCTYIKYNDFDILIDCGSRTNSVSTVSSYLNKYVTDNTLEYVIITHAHRDHYAGFASSSNSIFDLYSCKNIIDFGNATNQEDSSATYKRYVNNRTAEITKENATYIPAISCRNNDGTNREFIIDSETGVKFEVLYNQYNKYDKTNAVATSDFKASSENDYSVCTLFSFGEQKFLFTGDLESGDTKKGGEEYLVENNQSLINLKENGKTHGVTLYKAGHHGSKTSSGTALLEAIRPEYVGVCCCAGSDEYKATPDNTFPTQAFINRIAEYTDKIFVTTLCVDWSKGEYTSFNGNIVFWITPDLQNVNLDCSNNNKKLRETEWFANNRTNPWSSM